MILLTEKSRLETIFVHVPIVATDRITGLRIDPTSDTVTMTFTRGRRIPDGTTWYPADWATVVVPVTADNQLGLEFYGRALVGPGTGAVIDLKPSPTWWAHCQVVDNPQIAMSTAARSFAVI